MWVYGSSQQPSVSPHVCLTRSTVIYCDFHKQMALFQRRCIAKHKFKGWTDALKSPNLAVSFKKKLEQRLFGSLSLSGSVHILLLYFFIRNTLLHIYCHYTSHFSQMVFLHYSLCHCKCYYSECTARKQRELWIWRLQQDLIDCVLWSF